MYVFDYIFKFLWNKKNKERGMEFIDSNKNRKHRILYTFRVFSVGIFLQ